jgi:hypothetical protein
MRHNNEIQISLGAVPLPEKSQGRLNFFLKYMILSNGNNMALGEQIGEASGKVTGQKSFECRGDTKNGNFLCDGGKL